MNVSGYLLETDDDEEDEDLANNEGSMVVSG
jgi:hypothetical protein